MSGSFRTDWESSFQEAFGPSIPILREPSVVPSTTEYHVHLLPSGSNWNDCQAACLKHIQEKATQMISFKCMVFVPLVWQVDDTAQHFKKLVNPSSIFTYKAADQPASQISTYETWKRKQDMSILICTHAGAVGIDPPPIVKVYHLGAVWSMVSMFQAAGRSGRGSHGSSTFITSDNVLRSFFRNNNVNDIDAQPIQGNTALYNRCNSLLISTTYFTDYVFTKSCKRRWLSKYFDAFQCNPCVSSGSKCSSCAGKTMDNSVTTLVKTGGVQCDPMTLTRETTALACASDIEHQAHALLRIFNMLSSTKCCALCLLFANTKKQHDLGKCPLMCTSAGTLDIKCYRCAGSHRINQCLVPNRLPDGTFCFTCCCVFKVKTVQLHMPAAGLCNHGAKDTLFISCWYAKRHTQTLRTDIHKKYATPFEFADAAFLGWLLKEDNGLQNSLRLFGDLMEWNWRISNY